MKYIDVTYEDVTLVFGVVVWASGIGTFTIGLL